MKSCFKGVAIGVGMFTTLPVPYFDWDEDSLRWVMPAFPLVGGVVGLGWWLGGHLLAWWAPPHLLHSFLLLGVSLLLTGLLHLDGFMDTMDGWLSNRDQAERLRILKDPHLGAFGAVAMMLALLLWFCSLAAMVEQGDLRLLLLLPVVSRGLVAQWMTTAPPLSTTGYAATFSARPLRYSTAWFVGLLGLVLLAALLWGGWSLLLPLLAMVLVALVVQRLLIKTFGGVSGDLCGCLLVLAELAGLATAALM